MARLNIKDEYKGCHATELVRYQQLVELLLKNPQGVTKPQIAEALDMQLKDIYSLIHNTESVGIMLWETDDGVIGLYKDNSVINTVSRTH